VHGHAAAGGQQVADGLQLRLAADEVGRGVGRDAGARFGWRGPPVGPTGAPRGGDQGGALVGVQAQRGRQPLDGAGPRRPARAALEGADRLGAETRARGQLVLRQVGREAMAQELRTERVR